MSKIELHIEIDTSKIEKIIKDSKNLEDDEKVFQELSSLMSVKSNVAQLNDDWEAIERSIKQAINDKAKSLYGSEWKAIVGGGFKITRSLTGSVYQIPKPDEVPEEFLKLKIEPNSRLIDDFIKANSKLPEGVVYSPNRNESLRITLT